MVLVTSAYTSFLISSDDLAVCCNKEYLWRTDGFIVCHTGSAMYPGITKMLDKLAKTNVIHKNKANNLKSKLALYINKLA